MPARKTTTAPTQRVARPAVAKAAKAAGGRQRALPAAAPAAAAPRTLPDGPEALLRAGLKALGTVRDDVVKHHTNVIERLLGVQRPEACGDKPAPAPLGFGALDSFGLRKFEDVFDQRVAAALQRLGLPSAQELQALRDEVQHLRSQLAAVAAGTRDTQRKR